MTCLHFLSGIANGTEEISPGWIFAHKQLSVMCLGNLGDRRLLGTETDFDSNFNWQQPRVFPCTCIYTGRKPIPVSSAGHSQFKFPHCWSSYFRHCHQKKWLVEIVLLGPPSLADQKGTGSAQCIEMRGKEANYILKPQLHRALSFCSTFDSILIPRICDSSCCSVMHYLLLLLVTKNPG